MQTFVKKNPKQMTLKEYMHSNNLRKRAQSRSNSKQRSKEGTTLSFELKDTIKYKIDITQLTKSKLIDQLKIKLALLITKDEQLVEVLRMVDRLIQIFNSEIEGKNKQSQIITSFVKEQPALSKTNPRGTRFNSTKQSSNQERLLQQHNTLAAPDNVYSIRVSSGRVISHQRNVSRSSSEDIPNINLLLMTRKEDLVPEIKLKEQQETNTTFTDLMNQTHQKKGQINLDTSFSTELQKKQQKGKQSFQNINPNNLHPLVGPHRPRLSSSSVHVSIDSETQSNQSSNQNAMNRFQQYKRKSRR